MWSKEWGEAREKACLPHPRYHDLWHSALTLYAATDATLAEV